MPIVTEASLCVSNMNALLWRMIVKNQNERIYASMTQNEFERESDFHLAFSIFKQLFSNGLISAEQLSAARKKLVERFRPPVASLVDILRPSTMS